MSSPLFLLGCLIYGRDPHTVGLGNVKEELNNRCTAPVTQFKAGASQIKPYNVHAFKPFAHMHSHPLPRSEAVAGENHNHFSKEPGVLPVSSLLAQLH